MNTGHTSPALLKVAIDLLREYEDSGYCTSDELIAEAHAVITKATFGLDRDELIADLLAALVEAHQWIVDDIEDGDHSGSDKPEDYPIVLNMRAAIAKATGETP